MKPVHIPRLHIILIFLLVIGALLTGTLRAFHDAKAAPVATPTAFTVTTPEQTPIPVSPQATPTPTDHTVPGDTTGIIILAVIIVAIILFGALLGRRRPSPENGPPK